MTPNPPLRAAMIGSGMVSGTYLSALADLQEVIALTHVVSATGRSARALADRAEEVLGARPEVVNDVAALIAGGGFDTAILLTPPDARSEIVGSLAGAGLPIFMEKPVARTLAEARGIVETCESAEVPLAIALQHRARPSARKLASMIEQGALGAIAAAEITVPWWRPQSYYDEPGRGTYARDGGGVLINQAIHTLDLALSFLGPVAQVSAMASTTPLHRMEAEDFVCAGLRLQSGVPVSVMATTAAYPGRAEVIRLHCTKASVALAANRLDIDWHDGRSEQVGVSGATGAGADPMAFTSDWHRDLLSDFASALRLGHAPRVTGRSALLVHEVIDAMERASADGRIVSLGEAE